MEDQPHFASDTIAVGGSTGEPAAPDFDPMLLSVLSSRFGAILREMSNGVLRASKSGVIKIARDMSCAILTYDHRLVSLEECIPVHAAAIDLTTRPLTELFDDIAEGDAFLNNCPYTGVTHHADLTLCVPVFCGGKPLFWTVSRAHHADVGAPIPSTYLPYAKTIYEEGLHFPGVRVERGYREIRDIIRMARIKVRVPDLWYGDYLAQVGACRTAERRIKELVDKYGPETIAQFVEAWMAYGERRAAAAIRTLPAGTWTYENRHDPLPGVADDGIPVRASVTVDPDAATITVDVRDNIDCIDGGLNLSETCSIAACRAGVFYNIDHTIPHNEGSARRIRVLLRDGCIVGRPRYPVGTSVATTNVTDRLVNAVSCCFAQIGPTHGMAEGGYQQALGLAVISGKDPRRDGRTYVNQMFIGFGGGPGLPGHDGWVTYGGPVDGGMQILSPTEVDESMFPILFECRELAIDTLGHGEWDGAPGTLAVYGPVAGEMTAVYCSDGDTYPSRGVRGGSDGAPSINQKRRPDGTLVTLPSFHEERLRARRDVPLRHHGGWRLRRPPRPGAGEGRARGGQWLAQPGEGGGKSTPSRSVSPPTASGTRWTQTRRRGYGRHGTAVRHGTAGPGRRWPSLARPRATGSASTSAAPLPTAWSPTATGACASSRLPPRRPPSSRVS